MMINTAQRKHSASAFTSSSNLNVSLNIGMAFIQCRRARQRFEGWHLYSALPGACSQRAANSFEHRLGLLFFSNATAYSRLHHASGGRDPALLNRTILTLSVLGIHATGCANTRRRTATAGAEACAVAARHSVNAHNVMCTPNGVQLGKRAVQNQLTNQRVEPTLTSYAPDAPSPPQPQQLFNRASDRIRLPGYVTRTQLPYVRWIKRFLFFIGKPHSVNQRSLDGGRRP